VPIFAKSRSFPKRGYLEIVRPRNFSWIEKPLLAAMARPDSPEELEWLRRQGIQILLSLTEEPPRFDWVEDSGLLLFHVPMVDMEAPTIEQLDRSISAIERARQQQMGVAVHCGAGLGRTGVVLASYFVRQGHTPAGAVARIRRLRPGSIETDEQAEIVQAFARHIGKKRLEPEP
jgi:atypical dual specificity phosphatase